MKLRIFKIITLNVIFFYCFTTKIMAETNNKKSPSSQSFYCGPEVRVGVYPKTGMVLTAGLYASYKWIDYISKELGVGYLIIFESQGVYIKPGLRIFPFGYFKTNPVKNLSLGIYYEPFIMFNEKNRWKNFSLDIGFYYSGFFIGVGCQINTIEGEIFDSKTKNLIKVNNFIEFAPVVSIKYNLIHFFST